MPSKPILFNIRNISGRKYLNEWTNNTSIHGVRYLGERKRPVVEKVWWIIMLFAAVIFSTKYISKVYTKYKNEPVILSIGQKTAAMWSIPFPAITICSNAKSDKNKFNFSDVYDKFNPPESSSNNTEANPITDEEMLYLETISHICSNQLFFKKSKFNMSSFAEHSTEDVVGNLFEIQSEFVRIQSKFKENYNDHFSILKTDDGICKSFNLLKSGDIFKDIAIQYDYDLLVNETLNVMYWDLDNGYQNVNDIEDAYKEEYVYPRRSEWIGDGSGLDILIELKQDFDYRCTPDITPGLKLYIHSPMDFPHFFKQPFHVHSNKEIILNIIPKITTMTEELQSYSSEKRQCYLSNERDLLYFQNYTQSNCELECLSNFTLSRCGCVKFSMPRTNTTPICGIPKIECYSKIVRQYEIWDIPSENNLTSSNCNCLPNCNYVNYDYSYVESGFSPGQQFNFHEMPNDGVDVIQLKVSFRERDYFVSERSERYGFADLISNCGGLLGLFMGVSLVSVVEIIFFCTIRLISDAMKRDDENLEMKGKSN